MENSHLHGGHSFPPGRFPGTQPTRRASPKPLIYALIIMNTTEPQLVWSNDFDGVILDRSKWECEVNAFGDGIWE
jgi:hypothetical protein